MCGSKRAMSGFISAGTLSFFIFYKVNNAPYDYKNSGRGKLGRYEAKTKHVTFLAQVKTGRISCRHVVDPEHFLFMFLRLFINNQHVIYDYNFHEFQLQTNF